MQSTEGNLENEIFRRKLKDKLNENLLDLSKIEKLLKEPKLNRLSKGDSEDFIYSLVTRAPANQRESVKALVKLWLEKAAENNAAEGLLREVFTISHYGKEGVRYAIVTTLIEAGVSVRAKFPTSFFNGVPEVRAILAMVLMGFAPSTYEDNLLDMELLYYLLDNGAGADLITIMDDIVKYSDNCYQIAELITLCEIAKEDALESKRELTEGDGERIAKLYLFCKGEGIMVSYIEDHKNWALGREPLALQGAAAIMVKNNFMKEDIDKFTDMNDLPEQVKTFLKEPITLPLKESEEEKNRGGAAGPNR